MSHSPVVHGYLVLADISGYRAFLAQTELEHANEILTDLLETVLQRIKTLLTVHKIEGHCVLAHSSDTVVIRGEGLLELLEATYVDFRHRIRNVQRRRVLVKPADALNTFETDFPAIPPVVRSWLNDPQKRRLYTAGPRDLEFIPISRPGGRTGAGAITHCVHDQSISMRERVLDWKPVEYFTVEQDLSPMPVFQATFTLDAVQGDRTRLTVLQTGHLPNRPQWLVSLVARLLLKLFPFEKTVLKIKQVMEPEVASGPVRTDSAA